MILATVLTVLKIIGITLLVILAQILLILLLILFVPVRYKGSGSRERGDGSSVRAAASVSWLLGILRGIYEYNEKGMGLTIKVFGIRLRSREEKEERRRQRSLKKAQVRKNKKDKDKKRGKTRVEYTMTEYDDTGHVFKEKSLDPKGSPLQEHPAGSMPARDEENLVTATYNEEQKHGDENKSKPGIYDRLTGLLCKIKDWIYGIFNKISGIIKNISRRAGEVDYYINELTNDASNRQAISLIVKKTRSLLKSIRPRRLKGYVDYGSDDPAFTGRVLAAAAVAYPLYSPGIKLNPYFEEKVLAFDVSLKGRIYVCVLVRTFLSLYFNKRVKRLIKIMKKENDNGR